MTAPKPQGRDSATRRALIHATAQIMLEEGYAAATSRRVAAKAGVKPALVHYYFRTMDDLFLALFRKGAEAGLKRYEEALASDQPLRALWELSSEPNGTALLSEFQALANHRKAIRTEIVDYGERFRAMQIKALTGILGDAGVDLDGVPAAALAFIITAVAQLLTTEDVLGITAGHAETLALVERLLRRFADGAVPTA